MAKLQLQVPYLNVTSTIFAEFCSNKDIVIAKWTLTSLHHFYFVIMNSSDVC